MAKASLKAVSGLTLERNHTYTDFDGVVFTATWTRPSSKDNTANWLKVKWTFTTTDGKEKEFEKHGSSAWWRADREPKFEITLDKDDYWAKTYKIVNVKVYTYKSKTGTSKSASKSMYFEAPYMPTVELSYKPSEGLSVKAKSQDDQSFNDSSRKICTHIRTEVYRQGALIRAAEEVRSSLGVNKIDDIVSEPIPSSGFIAYTARAMCIGIAGNSGWANSEPVYLSKPLKPAINWVTRLASGVYQLGISTNRLTEYPVDSVEVKYIDIDQGTDPEDTAWSGASSAQETFTGAISSVITKHIGNVANSKKRYFRIISKHYAAETESDLWLADYGKPEAPKNLKFNTNTDAANVSWELPGVIDQTAQFVVYAEKEGENRKSYTVGKNVREFTFTEIANRTEYVYGVYTTVGNGAAQSDTTLFAPPLAPSKPKNVNAVAFETYDGANVSWENTKTNTAKFVYVDGCEVGWSKDVLAWESNNPPTTYDFEIGDVSNVRITELESGERYFFWVRLYDLDADGNKVYSPWSDLASTSSCTIADTPDAPALTLSRSWSKVDSNPITATWDYMAVGGAPLKKSLVEVKFGTETVWRTEVNPGLLSCDIPVSEFTTNEVGLYSVMVSVLNSAALADSPTAQLRVVEDPTAAIAIADDPSNPKFSITESNGVVWNELINPEPTFSVTGSGSKTLTVFVAETPTAIEMPYGNYYAYSGDIVYSTSINGSTVTIPESVSFVDGVTYCAQVTSVDQDTLLTSDKNSLDSYVKFKVNWATKAIAPVVTDDTVQFKTDEDGLVYAELNPVAPDGAAADDLCDIYRVTADGYVLCANGVKFGEQYIDHYPVYGWDGCAYRFVTRTKLGSLAWDDAEYRYDNYNLTLDWGNSVELKFNVNSSDSRNKNFEARTHMGGSKALYFSKGINRSTSISTQLVRGLDDEKIEAIYDLSRHDGICMVRLPYGIEYMGNVDVSIDTSFGSPIVDVKLDIVETDGEGMFQVGMVDNG